VTVSIVALACAASAPAARTVPPGFDLDDYIVGTWKNVDLPQRVYSIVKADTGLELRAAGEWKDEQGCVIKPGDVLHRLNPKPRAEGASSGTYAGSWTFYERQGSIADDPRGDRCTRTTVEPGQAGFYSGESAFKPSPDNLSGRTSADNPSGQYLEWKCSFRAPLTLCGFLSRVGAGYVPKAPPGPKGTKTATAKYAWSFSALLASGLRDVDDGLHIVVANGSGKGSVTLTSKGKVTKVDGAFDATAFASETAGSTGGRQEVFRLKPKLAGAKFTKRKTSLTLQLPVTVQRAGLKAAELNCLKKPSGVLVLVDGAKDSIVLSGVCGFAKAALKGNVSVSITPT